MNTNTATTLSPETRNALATRARELLCTVEEEEVFAFLNKEVKGRTVPHPDMPEVLCTVEFAQWDSEGWCIELFVEFGNSEATAVCLAV
jgi:hypothetical protein